MTDHAELRRLAKAATPGPWVTDAQQNGAIFNIESESGDLCIAMSQENPASTRLEMNEQRRVNAEFIAAANPQAILGLIADLEEARNGMEYQPIMRLKNELDRLKAENDALRKFSAEAYQVLGALDAPENVLDNASDAANGLPLRHETLLPFFAEDYESMRKDAERYRFYRQGFVSPRELDTNIDAALEGATQ
ncbi:ead/Ea22-like family protein [Pseudomonas aeruginosa]